MTVIAKLFRLLRYDWPAHFVLRLTDWLPDNTVFLSLRGSLVSPFLGSCGRNLRLGRHVTFYNPQHIHIGNDVYVAYGCWLMAGETITVGDEVMFGPYCVVVSSSHTAVDGSFRFGLAARQPIRIGRGSWLAAHIVVAMGARIGSGCLIGAQSVVTGEVPDHVLAVGQPAKMIKSLRDEVSESA